MTEKAVEARIVGKVQGVWFRAWTQKEAERIGVRGWVRNCEDGSVEALFAGPAEGVEAMIESCRSGPPDARVDDIQIREADDAPQGNEFRIQR